MGAFVEIRKFRVFIASGAWSAFWQAVQVMYPHFLPDIAPWLMWGGLSILGLTFVDFVADKVGWFPVATKLYVPIGLEWLRKKAGRAVETILNEPHFLSLEDAILAVRRSQWARGRKAKTDKPYNPLLMVLNLTDYDPAKAERESKFVVWCRLVLDNFERERPLSVRRSGADGSKKEYEEASLAKWLEELYHAEIIKEFGDPF